MAEKRIGFDELFVQMRATNALLAKLLAVKADMTQGDLIVLLGTAGLASSDIASIVGTTPNTVQVTLSRNRKKSDGGRRESA